MMAALVKRRFKLCLLAIFAFVLLFASQIIPVRYFLGGDYNYYLTQDGFYLLISPTCRIVNLNPWNEDALRYYEKKPYYSCGSRTDILTELVLDRNEIDVYLQQNHEILPQDYPKLTCCVANVTRRFLPQSVTFNDNEVILSDCNKFTNFPLKVSNVHPTYVRCAHLNSFKIYENIHQPMALTPQVLAKLVSTRKENYFQTKKLSVLFLGIDSISRLNLIRTMPHTHNYLQSDLDWLEFKIFQKMGDNTLPNLMAILTGFSKEQTYEICKPQKTGGLDTCPFVWNRFSERGYITAYVEDKAKISTFNYEKPGFNETPVDYYPRAYNLGAAHLLQSAIVDSVPYCSGLVQDGERVWDLAKDFVRLHQNNPHFGFFWTNSYSHEDVNTPSRMDDRIKDYLIEITDIVNENTLIIFLSDHGMRFGSIRKTLTGYLEERLPFLYFHFPKWFQTKFADEYATLKMNTQRMVTPFDIYMTLQTILAISNDANKNTYKVEESLGCPKCKSLFEPVPLERSCEDVNVTQHWCTCSNLVEIDANNNNKIKEAAVVAVDKLNELVKQMKGDNVCQLFILGRVLKAFQATNHYGGNDDLVVIQFETVPKAHFEVSMHTGSMEMLGGFSRSDSYKLSSACTHNPALQMFCYCKAKPSNRTDRIQVLS